MFKLIFFLAGLVITVLFSAFNLGNTVDISFGFVIIKDIPVFLITLIAFLAGSVFTLPFAFYASLGKNKKKKETEKARFKQDPEPDEFLPQNNDIQDV